MFFKFVIKNVYENKSKTLLLLISISLSAALFFITISSNANIIELAKQKLNTSYGDTEVMISSDSSNNSPFIRKYIEDDRIDEQIPLLKLEGTYLKETSGEDEEIEVDVFGIESDNLNELVETFIVKGSVEDFQANQVIISDRISKKYNWDIGSEFKVKINNCNYHLKVAAIAVDRGFLYDQVNKITLLVPYSFAENRAGIKNRANLIYASLKAQEGNSTAEVIDELKEDYPKLSFTGLALEDFLDGLNSNISKPLYVMLLVVIIMSIFIIYTSFNLLVLERMPVVGTFLSVGATQGKINFIFLCESLALGFVGGILGNIIGIIGSYILINQSNELKEFGIQTHISVQQSYVIYTMLLAVLLSILSSIIPIFSISRMSVKNIILNLKPNKVLKRNKGMYVGIISILIILFDRNIVSERYEPYVAVVNILLAIITSIVILGPMVDFFTQPLKRLFKDLCPTYFLALNNVTTSKVLLNNIRLTSICICVMVLVSTVSTSIIGGLNTLYTSYNSDIEMRDIEDNSVVRRYLRTDKDVKNYLELYNVYQTKIEGENFKIGTIQGIDPEDYKDYNHYFIFDDKEQALNDIKSRERRIILSTSLLTKLNKQVGESINLIDEDGHSYEYKITGKFNAQMANMGSVALANKIVIKKDFSMTNPTRIIIKLNEGVDIEKYYDKLVKSRVNNVVSSITLEETRKQQDIENNESFISILKGVSIFSLFIGSCGIINNMMISFLQRKKEMAVLTSIGMTDRKKYIMLFLESLNIGIISVIVGLGIVFFVAMNLEDVFAIMGTYMQLIIAQSEMLLYSVITVMVIILSNAITLLRVRNVSVIEAIKYE